MSEQWTEETRKWLITNGLGGESLAGACRAAIHEIDRLSAEMKRLNVVLSEMASPHDLARALDKVRLADHERDRAVRAARVLIEAQGQAVKRAQAAETKLAEAQKELDEYRPNLGEVADQRDKAETELAAARERECHHGWRGVAPEDGKHIVTPCPACGLAGLAALFIGTGGHLTCASLQCKSPSVEATWDAARERERKLRDLIEALESLLSAYRLDSPSRADAALTKLEKARAALRATSEEPKP